MGWRDLWTILRTPAGSCCRWTCFSRGCSSSCPPRTSRFSPSPIAMTYLPSVLRAAYRGGMLFLLAALTAAADAPAPAQKVVDASLQTLHDSQVVLSDFFGRLPDLLDFGLPSFAPRGAISLYSHPKFGDLLHEDYFRLPVGAGGKLSEDIEMN